MGQWDTQRSSDLKGSRVVNPNGDRLGTFEDMVVELQDGRFSYAIVAAGGFLGVGSEWRPVPPESLQLRQVETGVEIVVDISADQWEQAPTVDREQIDQLTQEDRGQEIYQFYGADWQARQQRQTEFAAPPSGRSGQQEQSQQTKQLEQKLEQAMTQAGVEQEQAKQEAQRLAQQFSQEQPGQQEIQQQIEQALTQAGVEQQRAQEEAEQLSSQVQQQIEFAAPPQQRQQEQAQAGQSGQQTQQLEQQIEKGMTDAGAEQQQAQQQAQRLAQQFSEEKPERQQIQQEVEQALAQAGVSQQQAQQQSEQLAQQIEQQLQQSEQTQFGAPPQRSQQQGQASQQQMQQQTQQIEQELEQAMTQAGVQQQEAQQEAQRLAEQFVQEKPERQQIQQEVEQALAQAGVQQQEAQQQAQQLAQQIEQQLQGAGGQAKAHLASQLKNTPIINQQNEEIGEVTDFLVSTGQGRVAFVLFSEETGLLQTGDEEYAVAPNAFANIAEDQVTLNISKQELQQAETISRQQVSTQAQELAQMDHQQASQQPQVFRYQDTNGAPGVYGAPDREQEEPLTPRERIEQQDVRQPEPAEQQQP